MSERNNNRAEFLTRPNLCCRRRRHGGWAAPAQRSRASLPALGFLPTSRLMSAHGEPLSSLLARQGVDRESASPQTCLRLWAQ